jgi:aerobic-type carbon monoxide dehydrogenase small subunit (CoxS/CutS family)
MGEASVEIALSVNGRKVVRDLEPQELLLDFLRDSLNLTGAKRSCDVQVCGACTVLVDGLPVSSCCFLAADAAGSEVTTIEGLAERPEFERLEEIFTRHAALQCGFCTPGMLLTISALLEEGELDGEEEIKRSLAGNLCRCTGYRGILEAVAELAAVE